MINRLKELKNLLTQFKYKLLLTIVLEDVRFHKSIGIRFTYQTFINLVNNAFMVVDNITLMFSEINPK